MEKQPGQLWIIAAPSGAGKTSLVNALLEKNPGVELSISYTSRAKRPGEVDGQHYYFISDAEFETRQAAGDFLESARVFGHYYGTSKSFVNQKLSAGINVILEIDWQGAEQIKASFSAAKSIFILPPSLDALRKRLQNRNQDDHAVIEQRMTKAVAEISHCPDFDYWVVNQDFVDALAEVEAIIVGSHPQASNQKRKLQDLLANLLKSS